MKIIAEIGLNHNGDARLAYALMHMAAECGADAVKFQTFSPEKLEPPGERRAVLEPLVLTARETADLKRQCPVEFISTPFDLGSLQFLTGIGVETLKISSGGFFDDELLRAADDSDLDVLLSTGMASLTEIQTVLKFFKRKGRSRVTLLHCVSAYPVPPSEANLTAIDTLKMFGLPVGYSDHTIGVTAPIIAATMGATVLEKHFTLDKEMEGPDHHMSAEPNEFRRMVERIREVGRMMGDGVKRQMPCEAPVAEVRREREKWRASNR